MDDCKGVSLGRSGSKGEGEVEGVDRLGSGGVSGGLLLPFEMVSWTALENVSARTLGPSRMMLSMEQVGRESAHGIGEMIVPWEWSYMDTDIVASVCSSIVACAAEREEVREYVELSAKLFIGIGQRCGCARMRMRMQKGRRTKGEKKGQQQNEGEVTQEAERGAEGMEGRQKVESRGMSKLLCGLL